MILNIELQKSYYPGYHFCSRGIFYCSRMISEQVYTEFTPDNYDDIKKVYSIWICMESPKKYSNTISEYSITEKKIFGNFKGNENFDLLSVLVIRLQADETRNQENKLLDMLDVLLSNKLMAAKKKEILEKEHQMKMTTEMEGDMERMCNLSDLIVEQTTEKVTKDVTQKVTKDVTQKVTKDVTQKVTQDITAKETLQSVNKLMENLQLSLDKACEALGKTVEEYQNAKKFLAAKK